LVWQFKQRLKNMLPPNQNLVKYEIKRAKDIQEQLKQIPNLMLLDGNFDCPKVPIFSFLIKCGNRFLHYNFVCALLNDVFGIQSRGGCQCAGPYAQMMLGMLKNNKAVEHWLVHSKDESLRPGVTRFSLPAIGTTQEQQEYVLKAIEWIARSGWKFMHVYRCNQRTGEWRHKSRPGAPLGKKERRWLSHYDPTKKQTSDTTVQSVVPVNQAFENADKMLQIVLKDQSSISQALKMTDEADDTALRWYIYPKEVANYIKQGFDSVPRTEDKKFVVGALRPLAWYHQETEKVAETIEFKMNPNYRFKDGEHTGEAPLAEIKEGFDDGELSDYCQIFYPGTDSWELISAFLKLQHSVDPSISTITAEEVTTNTDTLASFDDTIPAITAVEATQNLIVEEKKDDFDAAFSTNITLATAQVLKNVPVIEKHEKKKPSRDAASWGQGVKVPLQPASIISHEAPVEVKSKRNKSKHIKPPAKLMRLVTQAMIQWDMLEDGDRLLLVSCNNFNKDTFFLMILIFSVSCAGSIWWKGFLKFASYPFRIPEEASDSI
jgi:hypothetical protein